MTIRHLLLLISLYAFLFLVYRSSWQWFHFVHLVVLTVLLPCAFAYHFVDVKREMVISPSAIAGIVGGILAATLYATVQYVDYRWGHPEHFEHYTSLIANSILRFNVIVVFPLCALVGVAIGAITRVTTRRFPLPARERIRPLTRIILFLVILAISNGALDLIEKVQVQTFPPTILFFAILAVSIGLLILVENVWRHFTRRAGMADERAHQIPCDCGNSFTIRSAQAGEQIACTACGRKLTIPRLSDLRKLHSNKVAQ